MYRMLIVTLGIISRFTQLDRGRILERFYQCSNEDDGKKIIVKEQRWDKVNQRLYYGMRTVVFNIKVISLKNINLINSAIPKSGIIGTPLNKNNKKCSIICFRILC